MKAAAGPRRLAAAAPSRIAAARALGRGLAGLLTDPEAFERRLERGLHRLAEPGYRTAGSRRGRQTPTASRLGVRPAVLRAVAAPLRGPLAEASPAIALYLADRLSRAATDEERLLAVSVLRRALADDPERAWQLVRRLGREAADAETVEALAGLLAAGIGREPYRWAELEQLAYAASAWERRLVGRTLSRLAADHRLRPARADAIAAADTTRALSLCRSLLGDPRAEVQTALAAAIRAWARRDPASVAAFLRAEAVAAAERADGNRAWVLLAAVRGLEPAPGPASGVRSSGLEPSLAAEVRARLAGLHRSSTAPDTSAAHAAVAAFAAGGFRLPDPRRLPEPPLAPSGAGRPSARVLTR